MDTHCDGFRLIGPITALVAKRKRLLREYEQKRDFRWHGMNVLRDLRSVEFDICWALQHPQEA